MHQTKNRKVTVSVSGSIALDEPITFTNPRNGHTRQIERVTYVTEVQASESSRPWVRKTWHGHNVKKDGVLGVEFSDRYPTVHPEDVDYERFGEVEREVTRLIEDHIGHERAVLLAATEAGCI